MRGFIEFVSFDWVGSDKFAFTFTLIICPLIVQNTYSHIYIIGADWLKLASVLQVRRQFDSCVSMVIVDGWQMYNFVFSRISPLF